MAGRAGGRRRGHVRSCQGKPGDAVIERRRVPPCCGMASGTVRRGKSSSGSGVHGIIGLLPGGQMALRIAAIGWGDRQGIVVVDVAQVASHVRVSIREQETGRAVVENSGGPSCDRVACCACRCGGRETGSDVVRYRSANRCSADKSRLMAAITIR
jgi:hypothetical protein